MVAVFLSLTDEPPSPIVPTDQSVDAVPPPARATRQGRASKAGKAARPSRRSKTGSGASDGRSRAAAASKIIEGVGCVSQAEARQVLGLTCSQMLRLENQKVLTRIQEPSSRLIHSPTAEVQRLLTLIDSGAGSSEPDDNDALADPMVWPVGGISILIEFTITTPYKESPWSC